jgi:hypothetical protein
VIKRTAFVLLAALGATAAPAASQSITSPYDFVEHSMAFWTFGTAVLTDRGALDVGPGSGYGGGVGFSARISGPFNVDARVAYLPTSRRVFRTVPVDSAAVRANPRAGLEEIGTADLSVLLMDASLRFDITGPRTWYRLQPYALIGAGGVLRVSSENRIEGDLPEGSDLLVRFENGFTGHVGAGVEWHLSDRFTIRADARDILWKVHIPDGFLVDGRNVDQEQWVQTAHLSLGVGFRF